MSSDQRVSTSTTQPEPEPSHPEKNPDGSSEVAQQRSLVGTPPNHWLHSAEPSTFDLTRPSPPSFPSPSPKESIKLPTTTTPIIISPHLTALVIIDMQNFFLSTCLGRAPDSAGNVAAQTVLKTAIPAARRAGIRVIWLNWGLTDQELEAMPPSIRRAFGFQVTLEQAADEAKTSPALDAHGVNQAAAEEIMKDRSAVPDPKELNETGRAKTLYKGLGSEMGPVKLEDGSTVDAGRLLMRDTWNAALPPALDTTYQEGKALAHKPDVWIHKNRMSGLWGSGTPCTEFLEKEGLKTLLFAGVNTDQCVGGSLQDAFTKGYDCILISDACGTTSPNFATECVEFNCARTWGFVSDCGSLEKGIQEMLSA